MTREEAKELLPIIQALAEGKTIQLKRDTNIWVDIKNPVFNMKPSDYRIKPESKYRPFETKEECFDEMLKHHPFGWLKSKNNGCFHCIGEVMWAEARRKIMIRFSTRETLSYDSDSIFNEYTFADGTPFGME